MPTAQVTRTVPADARAVWALVCDPHALPRWWPGVSSVEDVTHERFTEVLDVRWGSPVRATFAVVESDPPWRRAWSQQLAGTPFARVLQESVFEIALEPAGEGTAVTLAHRETLRGYSRTAGRLQRRAELRRLNRALAGLDGLLR